MNERHAELTSALLDGELDESTSAKTISRMLDHGGDETARFGRYRLIGDVMRGESAVYAASIAERVERALYDEPVVLAPRRRASNWTRPLAGVAIAASVAAAAVVIAPQLLTTGGGEDGSIAPAQMVAAPPSRPASEVVLASAGGEPQSGLARVGGASDDTGTRWRALDKSLEDRLNRLVIEHHEFGGRTGINGPVAPIGLVSYGER